jgi:site-specific DNA-methyltransferase (adenine-specific)/site-specific DNA-methyltransferase (cytosine-N4-specific)
MKLTLIRGDSELQLQQLPPDSVDLVVTSPPYFEMRGEMEYGSYPQHLAKMAAIARGLAVVIKPGRVVVINVGDYVDSGHVKRPLAADWIKIFEGIPEMQYEDDIIWEKAFSFGMGAGDRAGMFIKTGFPLYYKPNNTYEHMLIFRKGKLDYSPFKKGKPSALEQNKVDYEEFRTHLSDVWHMKNLSSYREYAAEHIAQFPPDLPRGFISLYSLPGETVLDPFCGSGTTLEVCREMDRNGIGIELNPDHCKLTKKRLNWGNSLRDDIVWEDKTV